MPEAVVSFSVKAAALNTGLVVVQEAPETEIPAAKAKLVALSAVNAPVEGVPPPIAPGLAKVAPLKVEALRFATFVVEATENGAVPVASVLVIAPVAESVVKAPVDGVPPPTAPGAANVAPLKLEALRFATLVVDAILKGAVPVASVLVICPVALSVVNAPELGVPFPIAPGAPSGPVALAEHVAQPPVVGSMHRSAHALCESGKSSNSAARILTIFKG